MKKLLLYLLRWQASTPILSVVTYFLVTNYGALIAAIVANFIGGLIFYKIDKLIFSEKSTKAQDVQIKKERTRHYDEFSPEH